MANLVIDIGSTALKAAWADGTTLGKTFRYQGEKRIDYILSLTENNKPKVMIISSAIDINAKNEARLKSRCERLIILDSLHRDIYTKFNLPEYLSPDRAASLVASRHLFKNSPVTIFDFGTTLTVDFMDKEGNYEGGNISVGCRTRFKSINRYSKSLPLLTIPEHIGELGDSLTSSIESGIISGIIFEINGYLVQQPENIVVFTGGDANYFAKRMKNSIFVVCNLVLMGLAIISNYDI